MVIGLGIDIIELDRVEAAFARWGERLVAKLMGSHEARMLPSPSGPRARAIALAIAGKESTSKALGTGWARGVRWRDVVIDRETPAARLTAGALAWALRLGSRGEGRLLLEVRGNLVLGEFRLLS